MRAVRNVFVRLEAIVGIRSQRCRTHTNAIIPAFEHRVPKLCSSYFSEADCHQAPGHTSGVSNVSDFSPEEHDLRLECIRSASSRTSFSVPSYVLGD